MLKIKYLILLTNLAINAKIYEAKGEISSITNLPTTAALTTVENKIPNVSDPVKKQIMMEKYQKWKKKYLTISDYNKFRSNTLVVKITSKS